MRLASIAALLPPLLACGCGAGSEVSEERFEAVTLDVPSGSGEPQAAVDGDLSRGKPIELEPAALCGVDAAQINGQAPVIAAWETADGQIRVARVDK